VIKLRKLMIGAAFVAAQGAAVAVHAQESLDALLQEVRTVRDATTQLFQQRVSEYNAAAAADQARILEEAQAKRAALDATAKTLADTYSANELRINDLNRQLREKAQALGLQELFGVSRQVANDTATTLEQSLISTQFPPAQGEVTRDQFLRDYAAGSGTPTPAELERLWFELQREMTASGQVAKYRAAVVQPGGEAVESEVIRVGPFTAIAGGKFLAYLPSLQSLNVYPRQPPEQFLALAQSLTSATSGYPTAVVDPGRGTMLGLYVERPTLEQRIELGEEIGYIIILVGALGALAFLVQLLYLIIVRVSVAAQLRNLDAPKTNNPLGRVLLAFKGKAERIEEDSDVAELRISEAVLREVPKLERFQAFLRLCVAAGPLLGLIGTVWGMILTFQSITESGSSDPKLMATGIGQAMIATVLGLGIAIPLLFAGALLNSLSRGIVQILDEQSTGMLAESIERKRRV
jgi:biopolymer transport protein ExbB